MLSTILNVPILADSNGWTLENFLNNAFSKLKGWGGILVTIIGVVMLVAGIYQVAKGLISHGKTQVSWPIAIILILLGAALAFAGVWGLMSDIGTGTRGTIEALGEGVILPGLFG